jgi:rhodanese-related sulfurtransferase
MIEQQVLLKNKYNANPQILDVITPEEFTQGHIDDAVNVNWLGQFCCRHKKNSTRLNHIFVYCKRWKQKQKANESSMNWVSKHIRIRRWLYEVER